MGYQLIIRPKIEMNALFIRALIWLITEKCVECVSFKKCVKCARSNQVIPTFNVSLPD